MAIPFLFLNLLNVFFLCSADSSSSRMRVKDTSLVELFSNIKGALWPPQYNVVDDQSQQMSCLHVYQTRQASETKLKYYGVYHSMLDGEFQVRLAASDNLRNWTFVRTLVSNADMPYIFQDIPGTDWVMLAHEQWMSPGSTSPSRLGFKLFYNETQLFSGVYFNSYIAPLTMGKHSMLEGTPSIYAASFVFRSGYYMIDADIGFHYNDDAGVDQVAQATLKSFGPTVIEPQFNSSQATGYNNAFIALGAKGNIGQRMAGTVNGVRVIAQEANFGPMPPTVWQNWRVWLYFPQKEEGVFPTGAGSIEQLTPQTNKGSCAFGNPAFAVLDCPENNSSSFPKLCLFVSYFIFSEGAAPNEAGVCTFYSELL